MARNQPPSRHGPDETTGKLPSAMRRRCTWRPCAWTSEAGLSGSGPRQPRPYRYRSWSGRRRSLKPWVTEISCVSRNATETSIECAAAAADLLRAAPPIPKISLTVTMRAGLQGIRRPPPYSSTMTVTCRARRCRRMTPRPSIPSRWRFSGFSLNFNPTVLQRALGVPVTRERLTGRVLSALRADGAGSLFPLAGEPSPPSRVTAADAPCGPASALLTAGRRADRRKGRGEGRSGESAPLPRPGRRWICRNNRAAMNSDKAFRQQMNQTKSRDQDQEWQRT